MQEVLVRCSLDRHTLWFSANGSFATGHLTPDFRKDGRGRIEKGNLWEELTEPGKRASEQLMAHAAVHAVGGRTDGFTLTLVHPDSWDEVLPLVKRILGEWLQDRNIRLVCHPNIPQGVERWHLPLLERHG
ncbi:MAG TPA: hypothetical protein VFZ48_04895 [Candidatus Saccharimonadales bacterium]